jgi:4'-phosphopantetheinyl transferase
MPEVWKVAVDAELPRLALHRSRLTPDEIARAARFRREPDRLRFIVGRATRRELLARAVGVDPSALAFDEDGHGKPRMRPGAGAQRHFNSSHSGQWVLHAFADVEIGVDIEQVRAEMAALEDFAWVLSPDERAYVLSAGESLRAAALATVWVRKEAYVKALGEGLSRSLPDIGIVAGPDGRPVLAFDRNPPSRERRWCLADLEIDAWHKACVVHAGAPGDLVVRDYRPRET